MTKKQNKITDVNNKIRQCSLNEKEQREDKSYNICPLHNKVIFNGISHIQNMHRK